MGYFVTCAGALGRLLAGLVADALEAGAGEAVVLAAGLEAAAGVGSAEISEVCGFVGSAGVVLALA